jgi:hypothetical protein
MQQNDAKAANAAERCKSNDCSRTLQKQRLQQNAAKATKINASLLLNRYATLHFH